MVVRLRDGRIGTIVYAYENDPDLFCVEINPTNELIDISKERIAEILWPKDITRMNTPETNKCPVFGKTELQDFEICSVCDWENEHHQMDHPDFGGGANNMSLNEAREAYKNGNKIT
ncbi:MAG: CPCC family cysteine-rich protein [Clostridiales bacterium]|nr:CPCC family cysteine-rich protein [Clostridiales bacterium]